MNKRLIPFMCVLMLVTLVAAYGAPGDPAYPARPSGWKEADATKSFTYQVSSGLPSLHSWDATGNDTLGVFSYLVFDPLIEIDENGSYLPGLAKSWKFSDDYLEATIELRDDVYFTNGVKMTADDVIYRFEDIRDNQRYTAQQSKPWRPYLGVIDKLGPYSLKIHFKLPMPTWFIRATAPQLGIFCKSALEKVGYDAFWQAPVGTGAYVVKKFDKANGIVDLTLRTDEKGYWGYRASNKWTNIKNIKLQFSPEGQTRLSALRAGEVQMIDTIPTTDKAILEKGGFVVRPMNPKNVVFLQTASAPGDIFDNVKLRQALALSIDRKLIVDSLLSGYGVACTWPCRPSDYGYVNTNAYPFDPEKAKKLVAESGYKGQPIDFIYTASTVNIGNELTQAIQSMAADVGINLKIRPLEVAMYDQARSGHKYDLTLAAISDDLKMWWKIGAEVIGGDRFNTGFQNKQLKELGKQLQSTIDPAKTDQIFKQMYQIETTDFAPNIYLYWPTIINAWTPGITGLVFHLQQYPDLSAVVLLK